MKEMPFYSKAHIRVIMIMILRGVLLNWGTMTIGVDTIIWRIPWNIRWESNPIFFRGASKSNYVCDNLKWKQISRMTEEWIFQEGGDKRK